MFLDKTLKQMRFPILLFIVTLCHPALALGQSPDAGNMIIHPGGEAAAFSGTPDKFTGHVTVTPKFGMSSSVNSFATAGEVIFSPGSRAHWHSHPGGQYLIITSGQGWVQQWGKTKQLIKAGDVVWTPPGVKHWHGATNELPLTHTAIQKPVDGKTVDWLEAVTDEQYNTSSRSK